MPTAFSKTRCAIVSVRSSKAGKICCLSPALQRTIRCDSAIQGAPFMLTYGQRSSDLTTLWLRHRNHAAIASVGRCGDRLVGAVGSCEAARRCCARPSKAVR